MSDVLIKYRIVPFLPLYKKRWLQIPNTLEDLTQDQFVQLSTFISNKNNVIPFIASIISLPIKVCKQFDEYQIYHILNLFDPIFESEDTTKHFFPSLHFGITAFFGFNDAFKYVTFGEFIFADSYYQAYRGGDNHSLDKFIATLYRPEHLQDTDDKRITFNEATIANRAVTIAKFPETIKNSIALNYALLRRNLEKKYPFVFPEENEAFSGSGSWVDVYDSIVGDDIIHSKEYAQLYLTTVMRKINKAIKEEMRRNK